MKRIKIDEFKSYMGTLIDVRNPVSYKEDHHPLSINIYYDTLLLHYKDLLNKEEKYFIVCKNGHKSKKAVSILEYYGYDVTQVYYEWKNFYFVL